MFGVNDPSVLWTIALLVGAVGLVLLLWDVLGITSDGGYDWAWWLIGAAVLILFGFLI